MDRGSSATVLHHKMIDELSQNLNHNLVEEWDRFKGLLTGYIDGKQATMNSIKTMRQAISKLEEEGQIAVGDYGILREIFSSMKHALCLGVIGKFTEKIKEVLEPVMLLCIFTKPAASNKRLLCKRLEKMLNSKLSTMTQKDTKLGRLLRKLEMQFETSPSMQITFRGDSKEATKELLENYEIKEFSKIVQEKFVTEDVLEKCEVESINIKIAMLNDHTDQKISRGKDQAATKADVEKLAIELKSVKDYVSELATKEDISKIIHKAMHTQPSAADNEMLDGASSHSKKSEQETTANAKYGIIEDNGKSNASPSLSNESEKETRAKRKRKIMESSKESNASSSKKFKQGTTPTKINGILESITSSEHDSNQNSAIY